MAFNLKGLIKLFGKYKEIFVYGCGEYGEAFYDICVKLKCVDKIKSFVVSFDKSVTSPLFHEIPIITVGGLPNEGKEQLVFVAVGRKNRLEIEKFLVQKDVKNVAYMEDYIHQDDWENKDILGYCQNIADWYVSEHIDKLGDYKKVVQDLLCVANERRKKIESKKIGFVISFITARIVRIVRSLQKKGYIVNIFCDGRRDAYTAEKELEETGIFIRKWRHEEELYYYLLHEPIGFFWVDAVVGNGDNDVSVHLLLQHEYFGKIIYAPYDIRHGSYSNIPTNMYKSERYSLEHADGVIWRYLHNKEYLKEKFNIIQGNLSIEFLDYADSVKLDVTKKKNDILRLCWVVSQASLALPRIIKNKKYSHAAFVQDFLYLMRGRTDYILDFYAWNMTDEERNLFIDLKKIYSNFNFYVHVEHEDLIKKLRTYDYGICLYSGREVPEWPINNEDGYCENAVYNATSNKYFDYISAGIPIVASVPTSMCALLKSYGILVDMTLEELDLDFLMQHREEYRRNVVKAQKELSIDNHIERLVRFLDEVSGVSTKDEK